MKTHEDAAIQSGHAQNSILLADAVATRGGKASSAPYSETPDDSQQAAAACANALQKDDPLIQSVGIQEIRWQ